MRKAQPLLRVGRMRGEVWSTYPGAGTAAGCSIASKRRLRSLQAYLSPSRLSFKIGASGGEVPDRTHSRAAARNPLMSLDKRVVAKRLVVLCRIST